MFTSSRFAPPRTCSSATSTAPPKSSASIEPAEARRAGDVRALADHHEAGVGPDLERLQPAEPRRADVSGTCLGDSPWTAAAMACDVVGRRAAAAADDVHEAVARELAAGSRLVSSGCSS